MAIYHYIAATGGTGTQRGVLSADTPHEARQALRDRGMTVLEVIPRDRGKDAGKPGAKRHTLLRFAAHRVPRNQVIEFVRELSTLLAVGLPMLEAMDTLIQQQTGRDRRRFRVVLLSIRDQVAAGLSLAEAMREHPRIFDDVSVCMTEVGQDAGQLEVTLEQLADYREHASQLKDRVLGALLYPMVVVGFGLAVCVFLMTFVVPNLLESLLEAGRTLPTITQAVKTLSDLFLHYWWVLLLGLGVAAAAIGGVLSTTRGRLCWHRTQLRIPLLGTLVQKQAISRLATVMTTLLRSGVVFAQALEVGARVTQNLALRRALEDTRCDVEAGRDIGPALQATERFPATVVQVFTLGQRSGNLEAMLERLARDYDRQVATAVTRLTSIVEPLLIVLLAVLVGVIAFATILPILEAGHAL